MNYRYPMRSFLLILFLVFSILAFGRNEAFKERLDKLPFVVKTEVLESNVFFKEKYLVWVEQAIDHANPEAGTFLQRVFVSHLDELRPVVMITEGYGANYARRKSYVNELSKLVTTNEICIEHRFFNESVPDSMDWKYLSTFNAAHDHHRINQIFKNLYKEKWISTGISKGGQTAILYKYYFPDDVDICVPYVAPINFGVEDGRHESFLKNVSSRENRQKIHEFQYEVLKRRTILQAYFNRYCKEQNYTFRIPLEEVYDYCVLEYAFAFWQWGDKVDDIPKAEASDSTILRHFLEISSPDYFSIEGTAPILPFFIQAAQELGYYGYDIKAFKPLLKIKSGKNYMKHVFLPEDLILKWKRTMRRSNRFVTREGNNMLYIYGEFDPWSATSIELNGKTNSLKLVNPGGSHKTRINSLPPKMKQEAMDSLNVWLSR